MVDSMDNLQSKPAPDAATNRPERGQSLVEFALIGTFLLMVLMGILDLGRAYFTYLALRDAAAEGAYFAQKYPLAWCGTPAETTCTATPTYLKADPDNIVYRIRNSSPGGLVNWDNASVSITAPGTIKAGDYITVTVSYPYNILTPFVGTLVGSQTLTLRATSVSVIVSPP